jgi:hypothetical protein
MAAIEQWGVPLAVMALVAATLLMASIVKKHQAHQATIRAAVRKHEKAIRDLESELTELVPVPLSRELRVAMRAEILARLQRVKSLYRRYPGIAERIAAAESAVAGQTAPVSNSVGPIESEQAFRTLVQAFDGLDDRLRLGSLLQPIPQDVRGVFVRELGERRAEAAARFHLVQSSRLEAGGEITRARAHLTTLIQVLRNKGPSTDFVRELYIEAEAALDAMTKRQIGAAFGATSDETRGDGRAV